MSLDEINLFKARQLNNISYNVPPDAVRLFYDKISVKTYNTYKLKSLKTESHLCLAIDVIRGHGSKAQKQYLLDKAASEEEDVTNQIAYEIELKIEAKYMLLVNLNVSDGLTNDSTGILKKISFDKLKRAHIIWILFDNSNIGQVTRKNYLHVMRDLNIADINFTPIENYMSVISKSKPKIDGPLQVHRYQFPITCAEAITIHKSQGLTLPSVVVKLTSNNNIRIDRRLLYVGCSRASSLEGLYLDGTFVAPSRIKDATYCEMNRLLLNSKLNFSLTFLQDIHNSELKIIFFNIQSFNKHKADIEVDLFYTCADILMFVETGFVSNDIAKLPGFYLCSSAFTKIKCRGYLLYVKNHLASQTFFIGDNISRMDKKDIEIFIVKIHNIGVIGVYKAPGKNLCDVLKEFNKLNYEKLIDDYDLKKVFIFGDFNHNLKDIKFKHSALEFIEKLKMKNVLNEQLNTTDQNTHIDWCLSNADTGFQCGIYESYFSYHKPIWVALNEIYDYDINGNLNQSMQSMTLSDVIS
jgi:hypothetical protein